MNVGMLWFDADPRVNIKARLTRAVAYYQQKYGRVPNLCFIHPATAGDDLPEKVADIEVRTSKKILPDHFWLGVGLEPAASVREASVD
jgi:hypothetical protein